MEPDPDAIAATGAQAAFLALPHGVAAEIARALLERGLKVIDLSADFRLNDPSVYQEFYGHEHPAPDLLDEAVYGLPEVRAEEIKAARLIASPGCYPTSILLPLLPLLRRKLVDPATIVANSMSGVSGAGRKADVSLLFCECNESARAYGVPKHRHLSEIEQELSIAAGEPVVVSFIPHLIPVTAGIATTTTAKLAKRLKDREGKTPRGYATIEEAAERMKKRNTRLTDELALHLAKHALKRDETGAFVWKFDKRQRVAAPHRLWPEDHVALWARITCPTLLLFADRSFLDNEKRHGLVQRFPNAIAKTIADSGHLVQHDQPEEFLAEISGLLGVKQ